MIITKDDKTYAVKESAAKWTISTESGKLAVSYDVSKEICKTADELREYVLNNELF